ncbi:HPt (histidine-containing phosphotransfer) domain-containing protein [Dyadobacter sp. BE34]|uniref:HPt (Histidine-containing phosphotransfer) domain-containing protein n=1 Tax=Dyadobacter fermentans TaxID=94254 RepID=A0ABU1QYC7_9BACT|nr:MULTISPECIES: Hpt domain-containing protein [Dyadobacter]MDR6806159.1 HPt (histidine-containing phosphotransfer) domain-containing protein [Dyadobacter fermentans]MDR7043900.1 HPt (histidine-containing phosphotransfer) domain-containing protein [Dyadobacter sp. BE242]MDR7198211.1 HPt (histidine-containing phosphotransfer) domain-containing protein [Dyadobacter sp. BE34]MDR7216174.1 HPt (histidine-containing phosphotransfer) domain-containing protein [Dyadobacter sp. BE31]MDR7264300.1 HPt (h
MALQLNPALDLAYIDQAYGEDPVILYMIFDAFLSDSVPRWQSLQGALESGDLKESASIVHGLKPSFTMTGLTHVRPKVEVLEKAIKNDDPVEQLLEMYHNISVEIEELIPILESESERLKQL